MTLTEFLLARIAEDEAVARKAREDADADGHWVIVNFPYEGSHAASYPVAADDVNRGDQPWEIHATRYDPARVLAECEAKRRIVSRCDLIIRGRDVGMFGEGQRQDASDNLRALAAVYADHPDYDAAWAPLA